MSDQDQVSPNSIPPKVTPFAKPEGGAPVTPAAAPGAPRPITVRLKPIAPAAAPAPGAALHSTSRVPIPEIPAASASVITPAAAPAVAPAGAPATVRLRPVVSPAAAPAAPAAAAPAVAPAAVSPMQPQPPPAPGSNPLPAGANPSSVAQVQAAKSKTSRISLDSAIGVAPSMAPMGAEKNEPKTIRLKRPTDLAAPAPSPKSSTTPIRQTSRIPDSALSNPEPAADSATVTQKKTLKIKRPGMKEESGVEAAAEGGESSFPEGVQMTALSPLEALPPKEESSVFTAIAAIVAVAAAITMVALTYCLAAQAIAPVANANTAASISGPDLPWVGKLAE